MVDINWTYCNDHFTVCIYRIIIQNSTIPVLPDNKIPAFGEFFPQTPYAYSQFCSYCFLCLDVLLDWERPTQSLRPIIITTTWEFFTDAWFGINNCPLCASMIIYLCLRDYLSVFELYDSQPHLFLAPPLDSLNERPHLFNLSVPYPPISSPPPSLQASETEI